MTALRFLPGQHLVDCELVRIERAVARGGSFFRGSGQAEFTAFRTIRYVTPYLSSRARIDVPARWSRRIAAYNSTFDICGMTSTFHQEHPDAVACPGPAAAGAASAAGTATAPRPTHGRVRPCTPRFTKARGSPRHLREAVVKTLWKRRR
ncbi:hypothetical protein [Streptomyces sp. t39]|uniref:hypothetical protein n=1 Tax=Streptomyces sp. t39 TaxID=1828156 RepID=UPI00164FAB76|nr:hypothetical protein [Streptomyces sp. t39]